MIILEKDDISIVKIPTHLYSNWQTIIDQFLLDKVDKTEIQRRMFAMLKKWILAYYPLHKLCAFEDLTEKEARTAKVERGMYLKLRTLSKEELQLAISLDSTDSKENPRWHLEPAQDITTNYLPYVHD